MRASVASISKKFISTFFAATLALGLVPAAAFAAPESATIAANETTMADDEAIQNVITSEEVQDGIVEESDPTPSVGAGLAPRDGEAEAENNVQALGDDNSAMSIPAAVERVNEDVALTQPVAQQESTRSYFLAQTLESTKTVPIVSANLPLDKGMAEEATEAVEGEGDSSEDEGGEDSDESDLPAPVVSAESTVVGSFTYEGMTFAIEAGGESVALVAVDYNQLPEQFIRMQVIVIPGAVTPNGYDYYSMTRIADNAFASLIKENANPDYEGCEALFTNEELLIEASIDEAEVEAFLKPESDMIDIDGDGEPDAPVNPLKDCTGILAIGIPSSVSSIGDDAFAGSGTLQYLVVSEDNSSYASYDGALYSADLTNLRLIPEGRVGAVRVAPSATDVDPEAFSHCPSITTLVADPESAEALTSAGCSEVIKIASPGYLEIYENSDFMTPLETLCEMVDALDKQSPSISSVVVSSDARLLENANYRTEGYQLYVFASGEKNIYKVIRGLKSNGTYGDTGTMGNLASTYSGAYTPIAEVNIGEKRTKIVDGYGCVRMELETYDESSGEQNAQYTYYFGTNANGVTNGNNTYPGGVTSAQLCYVVRDSWKCLKSTTLTTSNINSSTVMASPYAGSAFVLLLNGSYSRTISFDKNDGTTIDKSSVTANCGSSITLPTATRTGYECTGWWTAKTGGVKLGANGGTAYMQGPYIGGGDDSKALCSAKTFYAQWSLKTSDLTFNLQGGSWKSGETLKSPITATYDSAMPGIYRSGTTTKMTVPTQTGKLFAGFYDKEQGNTDATMYYTSTLASNGSWNKDTTSGTELHAWWTDKTSALTFNLHDGSWKSGETLKSPITATYGSAMPGIYRSGTTSTLMTVPTQTGKLFAGFYDKTQGSTDATMYYTSSLASNRSWNKDVTGSTELHAWWTNKTSVLTFNLHDGSWKSGETLKSPITATYGSAMPGIYRSGTTSTMMTVPTKEGYTFAGFYDAATGGNMYYTNALNSYRNWNKDTTDSTELHAHWTLKTSILIFNLQGGSWASGETLQDTTMATYGQAMPGIYKKNTTTKMTVPTKEGYTFVGFYDAATDGDMYYTNALNSNKNWNKDTTNSTELHARWTNKTSILTFNLQGGSWASGESLKSPITATYNSAMPGIYKSGTTTKMTVPTKEGYTFAGFYDAATDGNMYYKANLDSYQNWNKDTTNSTELHAHWTTKTSALTFNLHDGSWKSGETLKSPITATYGSAMPGIYRSGTTSTMMTVPTKTGKLFAGFYDKTQGSTGATMYYTSTLASNGSWNKDTTSGTELHAWWTDKTAPLKFELDGGSGGGTLTDKTATYDSAMPTTSMSIPTKDGYDFQGYYTDKNCGGTKYYGVSNNSITSAKSWAEDTTSETTLYAGWTKKNNVTVTLKNDKTGETVDTAWAWPSKGIVLGEDSEELATKDSDKTYNTTQADGWTFKGYYSGTTRMIDENGKLTEEGLKAKPASATTWISDWDKLDAVAISLVNSKTGKTEDTAYYWPQKGIVLSKDSQDFATKTNKAYTKAEYEGYKFTGYYSNGVPMIDADGHLTDAGLAAAPDKAIEWKSDHDIKTFAVTWKHNAASGKADVSKEFSYGSEVTMIPHADNPGYNFVGWELFYPNGSAVETPNVFGIDDKYTMKDKGNVVFTEKWNRSPYTAVNLVDDYLEDPNAAGTIYHWPEQGYVTGESSTDVKKVDAQIVTGLPDMTEYGYQFLGWYSTNVQNDNDDGKLMIDRFGNLKNGNQKTTNQPTTTTWYAHWSRTDCPVDLVASYEPSSDEKAFALENADTYLSKIPHAFFGVEFSNSVENGKLAEAQLPRRTGYTFMGYYTQKNDEVSVKDAADGKFAGTQWIAADGTLSANKWNETPAKMEDFVLYAAWRLDECEVIFDPTGNVNTSTSEPVVVASAPENATWYYGKFKNIMPRPSEQTFYRNGYVFNGWYYLEDGTILGDKKFVSDAYGNPVPPYWDVVKTSITLYPSWTPIEYTLIFEDNFPKIEGFEQSEGGAKVVPVVYDQNLDLSLFVPEFDPFKFSGWYTEDPELSFVDTQMTDGRFTPRAPFVSQDPITLHALWTQPGEYKYTLYWKTPGTDTIEEEVHKYYFTDTIEFNGTAAVEAVPGWIFDGWVEVPTSTAAYALIGNDEELSKATTVDGFKPLSTWDRYFVAKWSKRELSVDFEGLRATDDLVNYGGDKDTGDANIWTDACALAKKDRPEMARGLTYDVEFPSFVLPDVERKGQTFLGWKLKDSDHAPERGIVVVPSAQTDNDTTRHPVYTPVFEDAKYKIVLSGDGKFEDMVYEDVPYSKDFTFPYPSTLATGTVFTSWAADTNTVSSGTYTALPETKIDLAPIYDEAGVMTEFGLAALADDENTITLHAVWDKAYNVEVPLFANLAIDTERGDVIAGTNTIAPDPDNEDQTATYRIESIRYEPTTDGDGNYAFAGADGKVFLTVYAGLNTGDATDLEHLLYADYVDKATGEVTYTDADNETATATPLLIELGGTTPVTYGRTSATGQTSLESVTDTKAPYGFVTFGQNGLTIRYGLLFEKDQTRKDFAFGGKYAWVLPANDAANMVEFTSTDPSSPDYGRRAAWSGDTERIAKLRYTVSLVPSTK